MDTPEITRNLTRDLEITQFAHTSLTKLGQDFLELAKVVSQFELLSQRILKCPQADRARFADNEIALRHQMAEVL